MKETLERTQPPSYAEGDNASAASVRRKLATTGVMIGMFLSALDSTAVTTAMPTVVSSLGGLEIYSWVFVSYTLTSTVSMPLWGRLSDLFGRKVFYNMGIALFLLGSILSGMSGSMTQLIAFRALQGLGAGALITMGMIIIGEIYTLRERASIQGLFGGVWGLSSILGPIIGGLITDQLSWRWVFYLNIPFGLVAAAVITYALNSKGGKKDIALDYKGAAVFAALISIFLYWLYIAGSPGSLSSPLTYTLPVISAALVLLFISIEKEASHPILPLELFKNRYFASSAVVGLLIGMAMFGSITFIPLFVQGVMGTTATGTGKIITPLLLSWVTLSSISGRLMLRVGYKTMIHTGTVLLGIGFFLLATMSAATTKTEISMYMIVLGAGMGMLFMPILLAVQNSVSREIFGIATSATQFFRSIGAVIGVTLMGAVMTASITAGMGAVSLPADSKLKGTLSPDLIVHPEVRAGLPPDVVNSLTAVLADSLHWVFITGLVIAVLAFISGFFVPTGREFKGSK
ncbi:MAG: MDR family MFS transporter [Thermodesulfobacteriota bacterium]